MVDFEQVKVYWVYFLLYETFFEAVQSRIIHQFKNKLKTHQGNLSSVLSGELGLPGDGGRVLK